MSLVLEKLTRTFGAQHALDGVSLHVRRGDCYGFIGHNGAGKTTAMRIVLGLQRATSGRVLIDGFDAAEHPREARARLGGLIEVPGFHGELAGAENLVLLARLAGMERRAARAEAARLLELVGLGEVGRKKVRAYSHGMRQRLGIATALVGGPRYVLLDEPTSGLDPQGIAEVRDLLRRLVRDEGVTVMLSSHQLAELASVCNRVGVLHRGRLVVEAETRELLRAGGRRFAVRTDDAARADAVLAALGASAEPPTPDGEACYDLGPLAPAAASRALVEAGLGLEVFAPRPHTLEEIYLATAAHPERAQAAAEAAPLEVGPPAEKRVRPFGGLRSARYEFARWSARKVWLAPLTLPAAVSAAAVLWRHAEWRAEQRAVASGELFSATDVTAFEGAGVALQAGLPLLALVAAGLASQALAGEFARGTLRNVLMRPLSRAQVTLGKTATHLALSLAAYVLLAGLGLALAGSLFGYRDLVEVLPNGETFPLLAAAELWPELRAAVLAPLAPLAACVGIGFLASALTRNAAGALATALGSLVVLDLARTVARGIGIEGWLPTAYLPSPLGDTSRLSLYADVAQGISNSSFAYADTDLSVPLAWFAATILVACLVLWRRSVP